MQMCESQKEGRKDTSLASKSIVRLKVKRVWPSSSPTATLLWQASDTDDTLQMATYRRQHEQCQLTVKTATQQCCTLPFLSMKNSPDREARGAAADCCCAVTSFHRKEPSTEDSVAAVVTNRRPPTLRVTIFWPCCIWPWGLWRVEAPGSCDWW